LPAADIPELIVRDVSEWRAWLAQHHRRPEGVWLVLARGGSTEVTELKHAAALEEALTFGWIDGQSRSRDAASWFVRFTPRRPRSLWSKRNVQLVERLQREGRMRPAGLAEVERAKADGRWAAAYPGGAEIEVPADLLAALERSAVARQNFSRLNAQNRYSILYRLHNSGEKTRRQRLEKFVAMLERGETIYPNSATQRGRDVSS
jgi:uncharacterized protein YdeI (YjbR/CyaY-like superfamily)